MNAATETRPDVTTPKEQVTAQLLTVAAETNRRIAQRLNDSPKITLAAAVLAFDMLEPSLQVDMLAKARVAHAEYMGR